MCGNSSFREHIGIESIGCAGTGEEHAAKMCARMPLPVIGGFTQDEGIALGAMLSSGRGKAFLNLNESIHGFLLDNGVLLLPPLLPLCPSHLSVPVHVLP